MTPLGLLSHGETAEIVSTRESRSLPGSTDARARDMGLHIGSSIRMIKNGGGGPLVVVVGDSRIAIDRRAAMGIFVRREAS